MIIEVKEKYTLLKDNHSDFSKMFETFLKESFKYPKSNLVLDLSGNLNITMDDLSSFIKHSEQHKVNGTSFVIVKKKINIDNYEEIINIVPTIQEAEDIIEMEAIERDLEF